MTVDDQERHVGVIFHTAECASAVIQDRARSFGAHMTVASI